MVALFPVMTQSAALAPFGSGLDFISWVGRANLCHLHVTILTSVCEG